MMAEGSAGGKSIEKIDTNAINVEIKEIFNSDNFISQHQIEINKIKDSIIELIKLKNINLSLEKLNTSQIIVIVAEISKAIKKMKSFKDKIEGLEANNKAAVLFSVTVAVVNSNEVSQYLSPKVREQIVDFTENGEAVNEVANLVDYISDEIMEGYDSNNDGIVTHQEIENSCNKSCSCCPKGLGKCWATFFISFLCCGCGKKEVKYH